MGVQGLWQILEPSAQSVTLESLEGKRLAVDISIWLHQAAHGFTDHGNDARKPHLVLILNRVAKLLYYKVRPVFVFDGDQIPVFKQAVLRDRQLKKAVDAMSVPKQTMRVLADVASGTDPKKLKLAPVPDDIMALDEVDVELSTPSTSTYRPDAFLDGYTDLVNRDAKIAFLADAKQRIKKTKLNDGDIPKDATDFHKFQTERILQRARINDEIEMIRNDKANQAAQLSSSQKLRTFVVDAHAGSHILTYEGKEEEESSSSKEKMSDKPLIWTEFVKKVRKQYYKDEDTEKPTEPLPTPSQSKVSAPDEFLEVWKEDESEDDDITEALLAIEGKKEAPRNERSEKVTPADLIARKFRLPPPAKLPRLAVPPDSSDSEDFEEVPLDGTGMPMANTEAPNPENPQLTEDFLEGNNVDDEATELNFQSSKPTDGDEAEVDPRSLYGECQQLLKALGLPYVVAPGEAEAQCAELERLGLVEGSVTDDSDIWLFGGRRVYKNMFSKKSREHFYDSKVIESQLGLSRFDFIELTMLAGGDYTRGFEGVGMVTALEILAEFGPRPVNIESKVTANDAFASLESVRTWLLAKAESKAKHFIETQARIRLRKTIEKANDVENVKDFPNRAVFDAYCEPVVSSKADPFKWQRTDFAQLEEFIWEMIGWTGSTLHKRTNDVLKKWDTFLSQSVQSYQTRINAFTFATNSPQKSTPLAPNPSEVRTVPTSRVQAALTKLFKVKGINREPSPEPSSSNNVYAQIHAEIQASRAKGVGLNDVKSKKPRKRKANVKQPVVSAPPNVADKQQHGISEESSDSDWD